jgi:hypothetical protein
VWVATGGALVGPLAPASARACDVCAVYTATEMQARRTGPRVGVAEQLTRFTTLRRDGDEVENVADERLTSSITQVLLGWNVTPRLGVQLNLPIISRTFRRLEEGRIRHGDETGIGDLALIGHALAHSVVTERSAFHFSLLGGLELPTGDSDRLGEELAARHGHGAAGLRLPVVARGAIRPRHGPGDPAPPPAPGAPRAVESGVHGHDLALGSGSVDGIVGGQLFWSWRRAFLAASLQYAIRSEGDFEYRYANDLTWHGGPGVFVLLTHGYTLGLQGLVSGETKDKDRQAGRRLGDTAITAVYAGPGLAFTWGTALSADLFTDLPVVQHNSALQILPDFRLRGGVTWRF